MDVLFRDGMNIGAQNPNWDTQLSAKVRKVTLNSAIITMPFPL